MYMRHRSRGDTVENRTDGFRPGQVVITVAGRESGNRFVVVGLDERYLLLADGRKRRVDRPKRKSPRHVRLLTGEREPHPLVGAPLTDEVIRQTLRAAVEEG